MESSVLYTPKEHFERANELAERSRFLAIRAKEVAIKSEWAAALITQSAGNDAQAAIYHVAKGLEALALAKELGIMDT
jgi:hypothetical protein